MGEIVETPCGEDRCAADAPVPRCVPATALPCRSRNDMPTCVNGRIIDCDESSGYRLERSCEPGALCVGDGDSAQCAEAIRVMCRPIQWSPVCVDDQLFVCGDEGRVVVEPRCDR